MATGPFLAGYHGDGALGVESASPADGDQRPRRALFAVAEDRGFEPRMGLRPKPH